MRKRQKAVVGSKPQNEGFTLGERGTEQKAKRRDCNRRCMIFAMTGIGP